MEKIFRFAMIVSVLGALNCFGKTPEKPVVSGEPLSKDVAVSKTDELADKESSESKAKTLVAYFSLTGNTETVAKTIQKEFGGELFKIDVVKSYPSEYKKVLAIGKKELSSKARPELVANIKSMNDFDTIFIGYPVWFGDVPMAILTFIESHKFSNKTVIPFCTHGSGGSGKSFGTVKKAVEGATVLEGLAITGSSAKTADKDIVTWFKKIGLRK